MKTTKYAKGKTNGRTATDIHMNEDLKEEIRQICTYYSELGEGTAGYDLSEEQFQKLFTVIETAITKAYKAGKEDNLND